MAALTTAVLLAVAGCGTATAVDQTEQAPRRASAQATLIGRVSKALDATFTAEYAWSAGGVVTVWAAEDGTWRVDVPDWALGGTVDVTVAWTTGGFFQCAADRCVKLAGITGEIPRAYDPRVQLPFVEWLPQLLDRHLPFAVAQEGDCFTLTPNTVVVDTPIPPGEWCLDAAGTILSVASGDFGTLELAAPPEPAAATVALPGEIVDAEPLDRKAPEEPSPSVDPSATATPAPGATPSPTPAAEGATEATEGATGA
ncbi:hypothetical protein K3N28_11080 [Glycomyces sp. TRM65418]|uniref:hypothetical protein n=1 Tax=Glycomyces sp. TRM65418 TaxID=2867006 RepID=UPI001CE6A163|nr:hypothetical protein [Glycomyces sp. TRM65418]MCC3763615.1 hypothetical protein [Glycomyces sp. TRM65418]QZD57597.1 hypothetical protein K3N28_11020 [Glycomyces sp. TRM65418]